MTSICLPNFVLLTLISTILHAFRTVFLYYKGDGWGAGEGLGGQGIITCGGGGGGGGGVGGGGGGGGVICHKKVQQSYLNKSLEPRIKSPWVCLWYVVKTS